MGYTAKKLKKIYSGEWLTYYEIIYENESGHIKGYEIVSKNKNLTLADLGERLVAISLVVLNQDHSKMLINKEFRLGVNKWIYNTTAGLIDSNETAEQAAERELREETGLKLERVIAKLPESYVCAPVTDEKLQTFIVEASGEITGSDNELELIESKWCTKDEVRDILNNKENKFAGAYMAYMFMWANNI